VDDEAVSVRRVYIAGVIIGVTFAAAAWLLTYRQVNLVQHVEYIAGKRHSYHPPERVNALCALGIRLVVADATAATVSM